jgi:hypothetical protein
VSDTENVKPANISPRCVVAAESIESMYLEDNTPRGVQAVSDAGFVCVFEPSNHPLLHISNSSMEEQNGGLGPTFLPVLPVPKRKAPYIVADAVRY